MISTFESFIKRSGVYCVIHRASGMCYIGSTLDLKRRRLDHLFRAKKGNGSFFQRALCEFGPDAFDFEVLCYCSKDRLLEREQFYIILFNSASGNDFNTLRLAGATYDASPSEATRERARLRMTGSKLSPEHCLRISQGRTGIKEKVIRSEEHRRKISAVHKGRPKSLETKEKMRQAALGRKLSPEHLIKLLAATGRKPITDETRAERIAAWINRIPKERKPISLETRAKMSAAAKGRIFSEQHRSNLSKASKGKSKSEQHRAHMLKEYKQNQIA